MTSIPCDIVLLPEEDLAQKAISASRILADFDSFFTLETGKFNPHMSLYMFQLEESDITKVEMILSEIAKKFQVVIGKASRYDLGKGRAVGYIDAEYEVTEWLKSLQSKVVESINPIRAGMRESDITKLQDARGVMRDNLQKYGYPAIGELFRPHMTLTRLKEYNRNSINKLPEVSTFSGKFVKIGLFEMGSNGTCIREIKTINLSVN